MRRAILLLACGCVAACAGLGSGEADRYFVLEPATAARSTPASASVEVAATTAAAFYDTQSIAFSRAAGTRAYYQFNRWTERPQRVIQGELEARYVPGHDRYILATHLVEMVHDAASVPGAARITVTAELIERAHRTAVARRTFTRVAPAVSPDAAGAVAGFNVAAGSVLDDIVEWADREAAARSAR